MKRAFLACLVALLSLLPVAAHAGGAEIVAVERQKGADGSWRFDVTVRHADEGWDHYADAWEVVAPDGTVLATRVLAHPHVEEQPFTRSKSGIAIPEGLDHVTVRARDSVHGYDGKSLRVELE